MAPYCILPENRWKYGCSSLKNLWYIIANLIYEKKMENGGRKKGSTRGIQDMRI
jgi:hypothetical protein